ncbi:thioredoxin fold domain-containing protein [bacterium]|nr:thioredoxin fold domain-containing protein [bacterium]
MFTELNNKNFDTEIKNGLKLVEFYTSWCGYCKKQKPELENLEKIWIGLVDADNEQEITARYNVGAFPTFLIFKNGQEVERFSGYKTKEDIMTRLINHFK